MARLNEIFKLNLKEAEDTFSDDDDAFNTPAPAPTMPAAEPAAPAPAARPVLGQPDVSKAKPGVDVTRVTAYPGQVDVSDKLHLMKSLLRNMMSGNKKKLMIPGDTGIGKTSFVKQFSQILGLPMVLIEVPHTVEEHLINIPFLVELPSGQVMHGSTEVHDETASQKKYGVELARSNLVTTLEKYSKIPDSQYAAHIRSLPPSTQALLKQFNDRFPNEIAKARAEYDRVLFLDEYFRQTTPSIRNSLRNLLDYRIGQDPIPQGTYIMYASNVADKGLDINQSAHATFNMPEFKSPSASAWLENMISGKVGQEVHLKKDVIDAFMAALKDEHLSKERIEDQVRISPRRWSEVLLQINASYPFDDEREASILKTTLQRQFQNPMDGQAIHGEYTEVYTVLDDILSKLFAKSGINVGKIKKVGPHEWRDILAQQVMQKEKMGEHKKYIPVVQGPPGIGKTSIGASFEEPPYNLRFIVVNSTDLDPDSITGIPTASIENGKRATEFSEPSLYMQIEHLKKSAKEAYQRDLKRKEAAGKLDGKTAIQVYDDWNRQQYRYIIFFDEINRVKNLAVFNALRRLILEKEFNHEFKLSKDTVVLGAMNPDDTGTIGMTDHFKDSIDLIDSEPEWKDTLSYIHRVGQNYVDSGKYSQDAVETAEKIVAAFPEHFTAKSKKHPNHQFYVPIGQVDEFYINPRDYDELFKSLCYGINREIESIQSRLDQGDSISDDEINNDIVNEALDNFQETLNYLVFKSGFQAPQEFWDKLEIVLRKTVSISLEKTGTTAGLGSILDHVVKSGKALKDDGAFYDYMESYNTAEFERDFQSYLDNRVEPFLDYHGKTIDLAEAESFLMSHDTDSLYGIIKEIVDAVRTNEFETGIFDDVADVVFNVMNRANKAIADTTEDPSILEKTMTRLVKSYTDISQELGTAA